MKATKELPFSLFIFDLDGTALGGHEPYKQFPNEFATFLDKLDASGIKWATATTWSVDEQLQLIRSSGVKSDPVLLTGNSGRTAFSVIGDEMYPVTDYMREVAELDRDFLEKYGKMTEGIISELKSRNCVEDIFYNRFGHHLICFKAVEDKEAELRHIINPLLEKKIYYPFKTGIFDENMLLLMHMNKGRAVKLIQKVANIGPDKTLVAGDETNDLHMFDSSLARYMICPANAHDEVKKLVHENHGIIATGNYSYGIMEAVNKLLSGQAYFL